MDVGLSVEVAIAAAESALGVVDSVPAGSLEVAFHFEGCRDHLGGVNWKPATQVAGRVANYMTGAVCSFAVGVVGNCPVVGVSFGYKALA